MKDEQMNIVVIGHVDHGKSTLIGRLLCDTGTLPEGKLEKIKKFCEDNSRPFEYAFLLDALQSEQQQGITIDTARCFFKTGRRKYLIIDAPGHIEFLKNMITGASRAEAALLLIDAHEGIQENSRRHGYMASMLGIRQITVVVNKMDLAGFREDVFTGIRTEFGDFLRQIKIIPEAFIPVSALHGENFINTSEKMPWYKGKTLIEQIDNFRKADDKQSLPFRYPVQDVYKFTEENDERRIIAGIALSGQIAADDEVIFFPSQKKARIATIEEFSNAGQTQISAGSSAGFTLRPEVYIKPGEIMCRACENPPSFGTSLRASIFWMNRKPMVMEKKYGLKIASGRASVYLKEIINVLDASDLTTEKNKKQIDRHDTAECILQTLKPVAFDLADQIPETGRFVIVDDYEIAGGGIILENISDHTQGFIGEYVEKRNAAWIKSLVPADLRSARFNQNAKFIIITGAQPRLEENIAGILEKELFADGKNAYYLGIGSMLNGLDYDLKNKNEEREELIRRLGEIAHIFTDAGMIFISTISDLEENEMEILKKINSPNEILVIYLGNKHSLFGPVMSIETGSKNEIEIVREIKTGMRNTNILLEYYL